MFYTYKLDMHGDAENYKRVRDIVADKYREYVFDNERKDGESIITATYKSKKSNSIIHVQLSFEKELIYVSSDRQLPEIESYVDFNLKHVEKKQKSNVELDLSFFNKIFSINFIKFLWLPFVLCICLYFSSVGLSFSEKLYSVFSFESKTILSIALCFGWLLLIPAFLIIIHNSKKEEEWKYRLSIFVTVITCSIYGGVFFYYSLSDFCKDFSILQIKNIGFLLSFVYIFFLPFMIFDLLTDSIRKKQKYNDKKENKILWKFGNVAIAFVIAVTSFAIHKNIDLSSVDNVENILVEETVEQPVLSEETENIIELYESDFSVICDYCYQHNYNDYENCGDNDIYKEWTNLFESDYITVDNFQRIDDKYLIEFYKNEDNSKYVLYKDMLNNEVYTIEGNTRITIGEDET